MAPWMQTRRGHKFYPTSPRVENIDIEDIAHALSMQCRFNGHTSRFYSVAEHSVLVSRIAPPAVKFQALMHDAHEAYIGDIITPVKVMLPEVPATEALIDRAIRARYDFSVSPEEERIIKACDNYMALAEARVLLSNDALIDEWTFKVPPQVFDARTAPEIMCLPPPQAKYLFLSNFRRMYGVDEHTLVAGE